MVIWHDPFFNREFQPNLPLRPTRRASELKSSEFQRVIRVSRVKQVFNRKPENPNQRFGRFERFRVEDLKSENRIESDGKEELFVPNGSGRPGIIGFGSETSVRIGPEDDVGFERAVTPVDVFEVLGGDDCDVEIECACRRWARVAHGVRGEIQRERGLAC